MTYPVLIQREAMAKDVRSLNARAVTAADTVANGYLVSLGGISTTAGEGEVFSAVKPATGTLAGKLWMVYEPEINITVDGTKQFRGINADPRDFSIAATRTFGVFKPKLFDIIRITGAGIATGDGIGSAYVTASDSSYGLAWDTSTISGLMFEYLGLSYISIPDGSIGSQRVAAYDLRCIYE